MANVLVPVDLEAVRARLSLLVDSSGGKLFTRVSDVVDAAEALDTPVRPPAAFVAVGRESAAPNRTQAVHDQAVEVTMAVLIMTAAARRDEQRRDIMEALRVPVIGSLAGWQAPGARKAFDYDGWRIMRMGGGHVWGELAFRTSWHLRL